MLEASWWVFEVIQEGGIKETKNQDCVNSQNLALSYSKIHLAVKVDDFRIRKGEIAHWQVDID
jgi:hypothetical protein